MPSYHLVIVVTTLTMAITVIYHSYNGNHMVITRCIAYIVFAVRPDLTFSIIRQWMEMEGEMKLITGK